MHNTLTTGGLHRFFRRVSQSAAHGVMLGGAAEPSALNQWVIIGLHARQTIELRQDCLVMNGVEEPVSSLFERLEDVRKACRQWPELRTEAGLPMAGGLVGCLGYGFARWCDESWQAASVRMLDANWPDLVFFEAEDWLLVDLSGGRLVVLSKYPEREAAYYACWHECLAIPDELEEASADVLPAEEMTAYLKTFEASFDPPGFEQTVDHLKEKIRDGEIYQANLSIRLQKTLNLDPYRLFESLCRRDPSPFSGFFQWPGGVIVCNSPERLLQMGDTGLAQTRPIAGTRGRGQSAQEDEAIGGLLRLNPKERAEHLMLVDLARNDLGRVCGPGSVAVDELLVLERYSHVTHLVSNVVGQLRSDCTGWDTLRALFPGGTITGCPKVRCVEILDAAEPVPRGFYTGSMGYLDAASGALDFNILIRSLFLQRTTDPLRYNTAVHVGAGIVHDAVGAHEYRECLRKAAAGLGALYRLEAESSKARSIR
jgi:para-aminobenzoate synthetase component 1